MCDIHAMHSRRGVHCRPVAYHRSNLNTDNAPDQNRDRFRLPYVKFSVYRNKRVFTRFPRPSGGPGRGGGGAGNPRFVPYLASGRADNRIWVFSFGASNSGAPPAPPAFLLRARDAFAQQTDRYRNTASATSLIRMFMPRETIALLTNSRLPIQLRL
ncbi:unnamed protein product, partial [Iphiclides podalirius]